MKKSNNTISDWLDKYGDPEIDKKVGMELEKITKEIYNKFIDDAYKNYGDSHTTFLNGFAMLKPMAHSKETFINECKSNEKFAKKWRLKITERELSREERYDLMPGITGHSKKDIEMRKRINNFKVNDGSSYHEEWINSYNIPTKEITLEYKEEKISYYE